MSMTLPEAFVARALRLHTVQLARFLAADAVALPAADTLFDAVTANHFFNCRLWREEDLARRTGVPDAEIVANKRAIDRFNQARNDAVERIDEALVASLPAPAGVARLHSETPGAMTDRLSILALKIHHMGLQLERLDAGAAHREGCVERLARLQAQHRDLAGCLDEVLRDCWRGQARFQVYRQFKMYNDPRYRSVAA